MRKVRTVSFKGTRTEPKKVVFCFLKAYMHLICLGGYSFSVLPAVSSLLWARETGVCCCFASYCLQESGKRRVISDEEGRKKERKKWRKHWQKLGASGFPRKPKKNSPQFLMTSLYVSQLLHFHFHFSKISVSWFSLEIWKRTSNVCFCLSHFFDVKNFNGCSDFRFLKVQFAN